MIQRIQSLYILIALVLIISPYWLNLGISSFADQKEESMLLIGAMSIVFIGQFITPILLGIALISFKKMKQQVLLLQSSIGLLILMLTFFFVYYFAGTTYLDPLHENWIKIIPVALAIIFISLANHAIKKDQDLLKSIDRIR